MIATIATLSSVLCLAAASGPATRPAEGNPGHLKMALVNIKCLYSDGPDASVNKANIEANLKRHRAFIDRAAG